MKISPTSVLDVGVGFGRWGILTREFCDVWSARVLKDDWAVHIEGIEGFPANVTTYHHDFYDKIHLGDAANLIPQLDGPWSVTIYGDVLEHFDRSTAAALLNCSLERSDYVLVNLPIGEEFEQGEVYGNPYERHLSTWTPEDLAPFSLIRHSMFRDFRGRPYGSFVLSRRDPQDLKSGLFSLSTRVPETPLRRANQHGALIKRIEELIFELEYTKRSSTYKLASSIRKNQTIQTLKNLIRPDPHVLTVQALGQIGAEGKGAEVWVLGVHAAVGETAIPYEFVAFQGDWTPHAVPDRPYGRAFSTCNGSLRATTASNPVVKLLKHPWSGKVRIAFGTTETIIDLSSAQSGEVDVSVGPQGFSVQVTLHANAESSANAQAATPLLSEESHCFSLDEDQFIDRIKSERAGVVAVHCPRWLGVSSSTRSLFQHCYPVPKDPSREPKSLSRQEIQRHAEVLAASEVPNVVFSGGDQAHFEIAMELKRIRPSTRVDLFWHGGYFHVGEDYDWHILKLWMQAIRSGLVHSIATCKAGKEDFFRSLGIPSALILNYIPGEMHACPNIPDSPSHVGLWLSGSTARKPPFAMIAAAKMVDNTCLRGAGLGMRGIEFIQELGVPYGPLHSKPIPATELFSQIRQTHVTMYITLTECCPMLPLESLQLGVPCLIGPTSHLFEDNHYLFDRLVVPFPERADVIARHLERAIAERHQIIAEYQRYISSYNARASASVEAWLKMSDSELRTRITRA